MLEHLNNNNNNNDNNNYVSDVVESGDFFKLQVLLENIIKTIGCSRHLNDIPEEYVYAFPKFVLTVDMLRL